MRVFHFTEQPYPDAWIPEYPSLKVDTPNFLCDPKVAADLYHRYQDEWMLADELGINIMVNEHHATATCVNTRRLPARSAQRPMICADTSVAAPPAKYMMARSGSAIPTFATM